MSKVTEDDESHKTDGGHPSWGHLDANPKMAGKQHPHHRYKECSGCYLRFTCTDVPPCSHPITAQQAGVPPDDSLFTRNTPPNVTTDTAKHREKGIIRNFDGISQSAQPADVREIPWCICHKYGSSPVCEKCDIRSICKERTEAIAATATFAENTRILNDLEEYNNLCDYNLSWPEMSSEVLREKIKTLRLPAAEMKEDDKK